MLCQWWSIENTTLNKKVMWCLEENIMWHVIWVTTLAWKCLVYFLLVVVTEKICLEFNTTCPGIWCEIIHLFSKDHQLFKSFPNVVNRIKWVIWPFLSLSDFFLSCTHSCTHISPLCIPTPTAKMRTKTIRHTQLCSSWPPTGRMCTKWLHCTKPQRQETMFKLITLCNMEMWEGRGTCTVHRHRWFSVANVT